MDRQELFTLVSEFIDGLLKKAEVKHAGNCLAVSEVLHWYLDYFFDVETEIVNVKVSEGNESVNHYCLQMKDGDIIDATASQFKDMPKLYIGSMPANYLNVKPY